MRNELLSLLSFAVGIAAYTCSQLSIHNKIRWRKAYFGFWGGGSWVRKYKNNYTSAGQSVVNCEKAPSNWYYKLIGSKYKERWFTSTWLTVAFTDGYHACQSVMFLTFSIGISLLSGIHFVIVWLSILGLHFALRKTLQR